MDKISNKIKTELRKLANPQKAIVLQRFFKTGKGQYGEGDVFLGVMVPQQRKVAKKYAHDATLGELDKLIKSKIHEERLVALLILIYKFQNSKIYNLKPEIYKFYLSHTKYINNWDLVDLSAPKIVGAYLSECRGGSRPSPTGEKILYRLAKSKNLWERRIAILSTFYDIYYGQPKEALKIAKMSLNDPHDLIHKAAGWMLREAGKRCGEKLLLDFLDRHYRQMPRTMLRYAIERLPEKTRKHYLSRA